jgi:hypothetical protein
MRIIKLLLVLAIIFNFSSCTITEKLIVNENGGGKFAYDIDGSKMMSMMGSAFKGDEKPSKKSKKKKERPSKDVDSTFTFKEMFAGKQDSISKLSPEEQAKIKKMERFSVHMVVNEEKGIMNYSMFTDFNSVAELQDMMSPVESMKSLTPAGQSGGMGMAPSALEDNSATQFFYDGKIFKKIVSEKEKKKEEPAGEISEESAALSEELKLKESLNLFFEQSNYKVVYQFPKAVKRVSVENALYSEDRKTITIEYPLKDYMDSPKKLNFEVEFE